MEYLLQPIARKVREHAAFGNGQRT